jgi:hypothetical protein
LAETARGTSRVLQLRLTPQRPASLVSLHVDTGSATVEALTVAGRPLRLDRVVHRWDFGTVVHAPPPEGIEITMTVAPKPGRQVRLRAMDTSHGLDELPGFRPRPPGVGVVGSHTSELVAVARTYEL